MLDEECRDAVGRLSVLGLTCWDSALEALGMPEAEGIMKALVAAEILVEQNVSRFSGSREWTFKHALVRDVAYASLGERERKELHALAGAWLTSMGDDAAVVAGHYDLGEMPVAAADHWERAAQRALATHALTDALNMAERALAFAEDKSSRFLRASYLDEAFSRLDPRSAERETAILALQENVYDEASSVRARGSRARYDDARGQGESIDQRLAEARDEAQALGLHDEEARCSAVLASRLAFAGRFSEADAEARRLLQLAEHRGNGAAAVDAYQTQAIIRQTQGGLGAALEARKNAANAARTAGLKEREAMLTTNLGFALTTIGARQEARSAIESGLALAEAIGSQGAVRHAQMNLLGWCATFGSDRHLDSHLAQVRADADASASGIWAAPTAPTSACSSTGAASCSETRAIRTAAARSACSGWPRRATAIRATATSCRSRSGCGRTPNGCRAASNPRCGSRARRWRCSNKARRASSMNHPSTSRSTTPRSRSATKRLPVTRSAGVWLR